MTINDYKPHNFNINTNVDFEDLKDKTIKAKEEDTAPAKVEDTKPAMVEDTKSAKRSFFRRVSDFVNKFISKKETQEPVKKETQQPTVETNEEIVKRNSQAAVKITHGNESINVTRESLVSFLEKNALTRRTTVDAKFIKEMVESALMHRDAVAGTSEEITNISLRDLQTKLNTAAEMVVLKQKKETGKRYTDTSLHNQS